MKRFGLMLSVLVGIGTAAGWSARTALPGFFLFQLEDKNPITNLAFNASPDIFQFAIVSDRTGGHRPQVFARAVDQLNLLQPEFVVSVGDLIEGYSDNREKLATEWREFQSYVSKLRMPFFYVAGNHDIANPVQEVFWKEKFGRRYYHFVYRNTLFLMLNSEDPPGKEMGAISAEQVSWLKKTLDDNAKVGWTFVFLHKPMWVRETEPGAGFDEVEKLLSGRKYTVFAGHVHTYQKFVRQGQEYYMLATTGGVSKMRGVDYGEFDHLVWVTMKPSGPTIGNILVDGILKEDMQPVDNREQGAPLYNRKPTYPVAGIVTDAEGKPIARATVSFYTAEKPTYVSDGTTDERGRFTQSTYDANDGVPIGKYLVTVVKPVPAYEPTGQPGKNSLPAKYARTQTTTLRVDVPRGGAEFAFQIQP